MWYLSVVLGANNVRGDRRHFIRPGEPCSIGRKGSDLHVVLKDDTSVSKRHCTIELRRLPGDFGEDVEYRLQVTDHGSKKGTKLRLADGKEVLLQSDSVEASCDAELQLSRTRLRIGKLSWNFCFTYGQGDEKPSELRAVRAEAERLASDLGVPLAMHIRENGTHLVCAEGRTVTVTAKLVAALMKRAKIVSVAWLRALRELPQGARELVDPDDSAFTPAIEEEILRSAHLDRTQLLQGTLFFLSKADDDLLACIALANGVVQVLPDGEDDKDSSARVQHMRAAQDGGYKRLVILDDFQEGSDVYEQARSLGIPKVARTALLDSLLHRKALQDEDAMIEGCSVAQHGRAVEQQDDDETDDDTDETDDDEDDADGGSRTAKSSAVGSEPMELQVPRRRGDQREARESSIDRHAKPTGKIDNRAGTESRKDRDATKRSFQAPEGTGWMSKGGDQEETEDHEEGESTPLDRGPSVLRNRATTVMEESVHRNARKLSSGWFQRDVQPLEQQLKPHAIRRELGGTVQTQGVVETVEAALVHVSDIVSIQQREARESRGRVNFKKFVKNKVRQPVATIRVEQMNKLLPKESERQLQLQREELERAEVQQQGEELFNLDAVGDTGLQRKRRRY